MLINYDYFSDVVYLDSTYCTNSLHRPLNFFSGFYYHRSALIFGAPVLYDGTIESHKCLFMAFLRVHKQKMSQIVFTNKDQARATTLV